MLSPRFHDLFAFFASTITQITDHFFVRFEHDESDLMSDVMSEDEYDCITLFRFTTSLRKVDLSYVSCDRVCVESLVISAINTLEEVLLLCCPIDDDTFKLLLKCPKLHTIRCTDVEELTGTAFEYDMVNAPLRMLEITACPDFTREGLRRIFDLTSIEHLVLDYLEGETISIRDFIMSELPHTRLAQTLPRLSLMFSDVTAGTVLMLLRTMPSLVHLALHNPETEDPDLMLADGSDDDGDDDDGRRYHARYESERFVDPAILEIYELVFPNVRIYLNNFFA